MANILVKDSSGLASAIKAAASGDTILLAAGTYSNISIKGVSIAGNVTIQSQDAGKPAVFTDLMVRDSKGLTFSGIEFSVNPDNGIYGFQINNSTNINLTKLNVHGTMNNDPGDDTSPLLIRNSTGVTVTNSEFQQLWHGVSFLDSQNVTITGNKFHDIRTDGIRGGGTSQLTIANNYFSDFHPAAGDHPDAIQLWSTNAKGVAKDITIKDNTIVRGGGDAFQGIFIRDTDNTMPFENLKITGNTVIGGMFNGIAVAGAKGVLVENNRVVAVEGQQSWIRVTGATDTAIKNNFSSAYSYGVTEMAKTGNVVLSTVSTATAALMARVAQKEAVSTVSKTMAKTVDATVGKIAYAEAATVDNGAFEFQQTVVKGTDKADRLTVGAIGDFRLEGGRGDDALTGGGRGEHELVGGLGNDNYTVYSTNDVVIEQAGEGYDTVSTYVNYTLASEVEVLRVMKGGLTVHGNDLDNRIIGSAGDDIIYAMEGDDAVQGGAGNDTIHGGDGDDTLRGDEGNDWLYGGDGLDMLIGGAGNDVLDAGAGGGTMEGGAGADRLIGGSGADTFLFRGADFAGMKAGAFDEIVNFDRTDKDKIGLSLIDAKTATAVDDKFAFIGTQGFHKVAGELRYEVRGRDSFVMGDTNGDGVADFTIKVIGHTSMLATDFLL
ncbi:MAG: right-handed parallel beta-helix repeat-containing protein [Sphingomonas sp.]